MQPDMIEITVNGEARQVRGGESVAKLLEALDIASDRVAVELNRSIVRKRDWSETIVPVDAKIEIVEFVGGG